MSYMKIRETASRLVEQASKMSLSSSAATEMEYLRKLLGDYSLAREIARLQVFIRGEGEVPDFDADVAGREDEIQAEGIFATIMSISSRFNDADRPAAIEAARVHLAHDFVFKGLWGSIIIALVDQEKEIVHSVRHDMSLAWN